MNHTTENHALAADGTTVFDKRGYAGRWRLSPRKIDALLAAGLPHLKIGTRRVRILGPEADAWMHQQFHTQRRGGPKRQHDDGGLRMEDGFPSGGPSAILHLPSSFPPGASALRAAPRPADTFSPTTGEVGKPKTKATK